MKKVPLRLYDRSPLVVAPDLIGKVLARKYRGRIIRGIICETESYLGKTDPASHAFRGQTKRNSAMFKSFGCAYVYFIYGMYFCFNVVCEKEGVAGAVLVRGVITKDNNIIDGPGKLCRFFHIEKPLNSEKLNGQKIWLEDHGLIIPKKKIKKTPRIGIKENNPKPWRFVINIQ